MTTATEDHISTTTTATEDLLQGDPAVVSPIQASPTTRPFY